MCSVEFMSDSDIFNVENNVKKLNSTSIFNIAHYTISLEHPVKFQCRCFSRRVFRLPMLQTNPPCTAAGGNNSRIYYFSFSKHLKQLESNTFFEYLYPLLTLLYFLFRGVQ